MHLSIYDRINIIERATPAEGIVLDDDKLNVRSEAEDAEAMLVSWIGSGCETAPTLTIDSGANGNSLALILNRGPVRDGAVCGDMGIAYGLHLELSRPVDVSAIETQILTGSH